MKARIFVTDIIDVAGVQRGFTTVDNDVLEICYGIPGAHGTTCEVVYNGTVVDETAVAPDNSTALSRRGASITPTESRMCDVADLVGNIVRPNLLSDFELDEPTGVSLRNSKSEDVVYIIFQCWLLSVSLAALIMESIPHSTVVLASHGTNTAWTLLRLVTDRGAEKIYRNVVVAEACQGVDVLGGWPDDSIHYAIIGINGGVFLCMAFLVYNLVKAYGRAVYSSVGSSPAVSRILRLMHWFTVFLQFASFYTVASAAAWFDKRKTDIVSPYSHSTLQDVAFIVTAVLLLPWFLLGIHCIRLEHRLLFFLFALSSLILLGISGLLFSSALYRYELTVWRFFGALSAVADFLLLVTCVLAVVCRTRFGLGLKQFLDVQTELQKSGFAQDRFALDPNCDTATTISITTPTLLAHKIKELGSVQSTSPASTPTNRHSSGSTCSVQSETFGTWLMATDKYGMPDKESGEWALSPLDVLGPQLPPGLESGPSLTPVSQWQISDPCGYDGEEREYSRTSCIMVRETTESGNGRCGEPEFKAKL
ncbi:hypothetical protein J3A83DRAFT_4473738 [Scleroderma citrinum]